MARSVFFFDDDRVYFCSGVRIKRDGSINGFVENGAWWLTFKDGVITVRAERGLGIRNKIANQTLYAEVKVPDLSNSNYNEVIAWAEKELEAGAGWKPSNGYGISK